MGREFVKGSKCRGHRLQVYAMCKRPYSRDGQKEKNALCQILNGVSMPLMNDPVNASSAEKVRLIELAQGGDRNAFTNLFQRYHPQICTYLGRLVENDELGRDLAQETFFQAWQQLTNLRDTLSFEAWLYRIATNLAYSSLRREKLVRWLPWSERTSDESWQRLKLDGPEEQVGKQEYIRLALAKVSPQNRTCLLLQVVVGFSQREIAEIMGISEKCVSAYVSRGREQFRTAYQRLNQ